MAKGIYVGIPPELKPLPAGYTQLSYIESTGTQYIKPMFKPNQNTRVVLDFEITEDAPATWVSIFGAANGTTQNANKDSFAVWYDGVGKVFGYYYGDTNVDLPTSVKYIGRHLLDANKNILTIDGVSVTATYATFQGNKNLHLFASKRQTNVESYSKYRLYSCKIYNNGTLAVDLVPCKNSSGVTGLYDLVNEAFYQNEGTGTFVEGNPVPTEPVSRKVRQPYIGVQSDLLFWSVARKIIKGYIGDIDGIAQLFYTSAIKALYTGNFIQNVVTMSGKKYLLLELISSGTLTLSEESEADVWICSGGKNGANTNINNDNTGGNGGNGGNFKQSRLTLKTASVVIGAGNNGVTSFNSIKSNDGDSIVGAGGGNGGGIGTMPKGGAKAKDTTLPFKDPFFTQYPCAGGGAGANGTSMFICYLGGNGGWSEGNGADGHDEQSNYTTAHSYGGVTGGGNGGTRDGNGSNATFYGAGGGGAGLYKNMILNGGLGYQGVCYVRIPLD